MAELGWRGSKIAGVVALCVAAVVLIACSDDGGTSDTGGSTRPDISSSRPDTSSTREREPATVDLMSQWLSDRLDQISRAGDSREALNCPTLNMFPIRAEVVPANALAISSCRSVVYERLSDGTSQATLLLRNESRVPIRVGNGLLLHLAVEPGETFKVAIPGYGSAGTWNIDYRVDRDGAGFLLANDLIPQTRQVAARSCAANLTVACIIGQAEEFGPEVVEIRGRRIPVRDILKALGAVITVASVSTRWSQMSSGTQNGSIRITSL
jgi:hypothetical protein